MILGRFGNSNGPSPERGPANSPLIAAAAPSQLNVLQVSWNPKPYTIYT